MSAPSGELTILIASYLEPALVERVRAVDTRLTVLYEPELLPRPRYAADHVGAPFERTPEAETRWRGLLAQAEVLFDFDRSNAEALPELAPNLRWIQATSAGIGQYVAELGYRHRMPDLVLTTASGVHARPLAEFCALAMLAFSRGLFEMVEGQRAKRWTRFAGTDLEGRTLVVFGLGAIGAEVARVARSFGMRTIGVKRSVEGVDAASLNVDRLEDRAHLHAALREAEFLVLAAPHTPETEGAIGAEELRALPRGAVVINVGRGSLIDESALVDALRSGHLGGAALDVFEEEPLPPESPLWDMPNVLVSPHSAATSDRENERMVELFCENLQRFLAGRPLLNVLDFERRY